METKEQHLWDIVEGKYEFGDTLNLRFAEVLAERDAAREELAKLKAAQPAAEPSTPLSRAESDIFAERASQRSRWGEDHDDEHAKGQLARAAAAYAASDESLWPFADGWKPRSRREDLVRAAALLIAEIERMDRFDESFQAPEVRAMHAALASAPFRTGGSKCSMEIIPASAEAPVADPAAREGPFTLDDSGSILPMTRIMRNRMYVADLQSVSEIEEKEFIYLLEEAPPGAKEIEAMKTKAALKMRHETDYSGYVLGAPVGKGRLPRGTKVARVPLKKINAIAALRRELAAVKAKECSERLEKETAQRLLKESEQRAAALHEEAKFQEGRKDYLLKQREELDGQFSAATAGMAFTSLRPRNAHAAMIIALGAHRLAQGEVEYLEDRVKALRSDLDGERAQLEELRTAIRTWAESYFSADDPARAWVLSLLDPVEARAAAVNLEARMGTYAAAEGKIA